MIKLIERIERIAQLPVDATEPQSHNYYLSLRQFELRFSGSSNPPNRFDQFTRFLSQ